MKGMSKAIKQRGKVPDGRWGDVSSGGGGEKKAGGGGWVIRAI